MSTDPSGPRLTPAERVLVRTGPNCITVLFESRGGFDPGPALSSLHRMVNGAERFRRTLGASRFGPLSNVDWPAHVALLSAAGLDGATLMDAMRRLHLPPDRPLWRALLVNPDGAGWSGVALQFDHAIADGTRMARHVTTEAFPGPIARLPFDDLPMWSLPDLLACADTRLDPPGSGLARITFDGLSRAMPGAAGHSDALLRLGRHMLQNDPAFARLPDTRRDHAAVARIEALRSADGVLGNRARMDHLDLSRKSDGARALFDAGRTPAMERARMALSRLVPAALLRRIVEAEFSRPGIVLTVVPVARRVPRLFGMEIAAIHPAAPVLGRPPLALTAVRTGDGFDLTVTAHEPAGEAVDGLSTRVAAAMAGAVQ